MPIDQVKKFLEGQNPEKLNEAAGKIKAAEKAETGWTAEDEKTLNNLLGVIKNSNKIIEDAQKRLAEINAEEAEVKKQKKLSETREREKTIESPGKEVKERLKKFYISCPHPDGFWDISYEAPGFKPTVSVYEFTTNENGDSAEFVFYNDSSTLISVLRSPSDYLNPVCNNVNAYNPYAKSITTITPGRAEKIGERWVVKDKAKIFYGTKDEYREHLKKES